MTFKRYLPRTKPVKAIQYTQETRDFIISKVPGIVHESVDVRGNVYPMDSLILLNDNSLSLRLRPGQWLVVSDDHHLQILDDDVFQQTYGRYI